MFSLAVALIIQTQAPLNHLVVMALSVVAVNAEVVVLKAKKTQSSVVYRALTIPAKEEKSKSGARRATRARCGSTLWVSVSTNTQNKSRTTAMHCERLPVSVYTWYTKV